MDMPLQSQRGLNFLGNGVPVLAAGIQQSGETMVQRDIQAKRQ
jgi:hypothetical protein